MALKSRLFRRLTARLVIEPIFGLGERTPPNKGFSQNFGLDPRIAGLMLIVDLMLNAGDIVSMGLLVPFSIAAGIVLGYITYKAQMNWYGDDKESAKIKAIVVALLTAIPTPLPAILYVPAGYWACYAMLVGS